MMARWRAAALVRLPELRHVIAVSDSVMALWIELLLALQAAYEEPRNESLIAQIYSYADWCLTAPRGTEARYDPLTALLVAFYEHLPTIPAARADMPRWFCAAEVLQNKQVFAYHLGEEAFQELVDYLKKNRHWYQPRARPGDTP